MKAKEKKPEWGKPFNEVDAIIRYENGEMTEGETTELFQHLVNTGLAWQLQGHYGRTASELINQGKVRLHAR